MILAVVFCATVLAGVMAATESALGRVTYGDISRLVDKGNERAEIVQRVLDEPAPVLNVAVFLRLLAEVTAVGGVMITVAQWTGLGAWLRLPLVAVMMAVILFAAVGVGPRTLGRQHAVAIALVTVPPLRTITWLLGPFATVLVFLGNALTPGKGFASGPFTSEVELRSLVDKSADTQMIEDEERAMVHAIFELGDTLAREVMVPRTEMVTVRSGTSLDSVMRLFVRSGFSRVPVVGEDGADDVQGVLYLKDVLAHSQKASADLQAEDVDSQMRKPVFVPESVPVAVLLRDMQGRSAHVAILIDEYGGVAGLATIEDLIEEIVGEIADEHDTVAEEREEITPGTYRVSARTNITEVAELLDTDIDDDQVDSIGGLLAKTLGMVPIPGAHAYVDDVFIEADRFEGRRRRMSTVIVRRVPDKEKVDTTDALGDSETMGSQVNQNG